MTTTQPWHDLPNAALIDRILAAVRARPEVWTAAAWDAAGDAAWDAASDAAWSAAGDAAWDAASDAARAAAGAAACAARDTVTAAWAILALIAWDDCAHLLDTDPDQVQVLALLGQPAAVLLYPACRALHKSSIKSMTYST